MNVIAMIVLLRIFKALAIKRCCEFVSVGEQIQE